MSDRAPEFTDEDLEAAVRIARSNVLYAFTGNDQNGATIRAVRDIVNVLEDISADVAKYGIEVALPNFIRVVGKHGEFRIDPQKDFVRILIEHMEPVKTAPRKNTRAT